MGAPIDVLAVMDAVLAFAARGVESDDPAREMIESGYEARAAVAELIGAAEGQHKAVDLLLARMIELDPEFRPTKSSVWPLLVAARAALARVQGGAA